MCAEINMANLEKGNETTRRRQSGFALRIPRLCPFKWFSPADGAQGISFQQPLVYTLPVELVSAAKPSYFVSDLKVRQAYGTLCRRHAPLVSVWLRLPKIFFEPSPPLQLLPQIAEYLCPVLACVEHNIHHKCCVQKPWRDHYRNYVVAALPALCDAEREHYWNLNGAALLNGGW